YFGVCLGSQLLASALGSRVFRGPEPELGVNPVFLCEAARRDPVFRAFPPDVVRDWFDAWPSLGETFEARYGRGSLAGFLEEYARSMPLLQQTARQLFRRWLANALAHGRPASAASDAGTATVSDERLFGRAREQERISRLLEEARAGRGGVTVICGE